MNYIISWRKFIFIVDFCCSFIVFMIFIPPVLIIISLIVKPLYDMWNKADEYIDVQNRIVRERLSGLRVIRAFNNEKKEHERAKFATEEMSKYIIKSNVRSGYITPVALLILNIATVAMIWLGAYRAKLGAITAAGSVIAAIQYVSLISNAILTLSWTIAWIPHLKVSIKRIGEVLNMPKVDDGADDVISERFKNDNGVDIELKDVSFAYPDSNAPTLKGINMKFSKGETVAIIGGTGSGKTTLMRLLLSFYSANSGEISINGNLYSNLTKSEIRSAFSPALQRGMIFEGTVRDNISIGKSDASDEELMSIAEVCELSEFINSHKEGLDYFLVGMGQNASGGQKQRINMARAVIREAAAYIFDDSFSALDYITERKIQKKLFEKLKDKTKIIVTQRVSTALAAERIYVMERGEIVGEGNHNSLLKSSSVYREICVSQLGEERVKEALLNEENS